MELKTSQAVGLKELVATLVVSGVLLMVGVIVFATVKSSLNTSTLSTSANSTVNSIENTAYSAFQLATVALIVLAAAVIIGILILNGSNKILPQQEKSIWCIKTPTASYIPISCE